MAGVVERSSYGIEGRHVSSDYLRDVADSLAREIFKDDKTASKITQHGWARNNAVGGNTFYYPDLSYAREHFVNQQHLFFQRFCEIAGFPNADALADLLKTLNNIPDLGWASIPEADLQSLADEYYARINQPAKQIKVVYDKDESYRARCNASLLNAWKNIHDAGKESDRMLEIGSAEIFAGLTALHAVERRRGADWLHSTELYNYAQMAGGWAVVEDILKDKGFAKGNPFVPIFEIFRSSCPIGELDNRFVIYRQATPSQVQTAQSIA